MSKFKKTFAALLSIGAMVVVVSIFVRADTLPGLDSVEELGRALGIWSLLPPVFAVLLAFLTGDVILSLLAGVIVGAAMLTALNGDGVLYATFHRAVVSIVDTSADWENVRVLLLCVAVGGMEGVIRYSGGFETTARVLSKRLRSPRKVNLISQLFCILFFFDDYANALISGPVLTPVLEPLHIPAALCVVAFSEK